MSKGSLDHRRAKHVLLSCRAKGGSDPAGLVPQRLELRTRKRAPEHSQRCAHPAQRDPGLMNGLRLIGRAQGIPVSNELRQGVRNDRHHGIVERHRGRIEVESHEGQGACFTVWVPEADPSTANAL